MSEPVMRALSDHLGKHAAHDAVYRAAMRGIDAGVDLRAVLLGDADIVAALGVSELDRRLDPRAAVGSAPAFVDRVVAAARAIRATEPHELPPLRTPSAATAAPA
jgi:adenylosuccinate lyase